jgi:hypothetical protein
MKKEVLAMPDLIAPQPPPKIYQSAKKEAQRTITAIQEHFIGLFEITCFIIRFVEMLECCDTKAAVVALKSIYTVCSLKVTEEFDEYANGDHAGYLLACYKCSLVDIYLEGLAKEKLISYGVESFEPPTRSQVCLHAENTDDETVCILCQALQAFYTDSNLHSDGLDSSLTRGHLAHHKTE